MNEVEVYNKINFDAMSTEFLNGYTKIVREIVYTHVKQVVNRQGIFLNYSNCNIDFDFSYAKLIAEIVDKGIK